MTRHSYLTENGPCGQLETRHTKTMLPTIPSFSTQYKRKSRNHSMWMCISPPPGGNISSFHAIRTGLNASIHGKQLLSAVETKTTSRLWRKHCQLVGSKRRFSQLDDSCKLFMLQRAMKCLFAETQEKRVLLLKLGCLMGVRTSRIPQYLIVLAEFSACALLHGQSEEHENNEHVFGGFFSVDGIFRRVCDSDRCLIRCNMIYATSTCVRCSFMREPLW